MWQCQHGREEGWRGGRTSSTRDVPMVREVHREWQILGCNHGEGSTIGRIWEYEKCLFLVYECKQWLRNYHDLELLHGHLWVVQWLAYCTPPARGWFLMRTWTCASLIFIQTTDRPRSQRSACVETLLVISSDVLIWFGFSMSTSDCLGRSRFYALCCNIRDGCGRAGSKHQKSWEMKNWIHWDCCSGELLDELWL